MATVIMVSCVAGLLLYWELQLKALQAISRRAAQRHLDRKVSAMAHALLTLAKHYGGLRVDLDRRLVTDVPSPTLVCANHQSVADIVVLMDALSSHRLRFVAKKELAHGFPAVSEVLRIQRHALINRTGEFRTGVAELHRLGRETAKGISPVVFPEGTRSRTGEVRDFSPGAVRTILDGALLPITAVAVDGGHRFVSVSDITKGLSSITYRARLVGVFHHDGTKRGILAAIEQAHAAVVNQMTRWRSQQ